MNRIELRDALDERFNVHELHDICFTLDINYENFSVHRTVLARQIVEFCERSNKINELIEACKNERPGYKDWAYEVTPIGKLDIDPFNDQFRQRGCYAHVGKFKFAVILTIGILFGIFAIRTLPGGAEVHIKIEPAQVEPIAGTEFNRVVLTEKAAQRLGIETNTIQESEAGKIVPYGAVIYGLSGETWVYTVMEPLTYTRATITIDHIDGDMAVLLDGPPVGTEVVTVAVAFLYGVDTGVGKQ